MGSLVTQNSIVAKTELLSQLLQRLQHTKYIHKIYIQYTKYDHMIYKMQANLVNTRLVKI